LWNRGGTYPVKDLHEVLSFCWGELRFSAWGLFSPLGGRNDEGDKLWLDLQLQEIFIGDRGNIWESRKKVCSSVGQGVVGEVGCDGMWLTLRALSSVRHIDPRASERGDVDEGRKKTGRI
jgi:hypothetical protein